MSKPVKHKKSTSPSASPQAKRYGLAEKNLAELIKHIDSLQQESLSETEAVRQRIQTVLIYHRKIRHGKVLSAADYNIAVDVCKTTQRLCQLIEGSPHHAPMMQLSQHVLDDFAKLIKA